MTTRDWKFHVWKSTATSLSTSLVDFTITNAQLAETPTITGSRLRVLDGQTEARPWTISVLDASSFLTRQLASTNGRLDMLNRFVQARLSIDGSTYAPVAGGRLIDLTNGGNIATWALTVQDEWLAGANTMLFTTNTTLLYPPRPYRGYKGAAEGRAAVGNIARITSTNYSSLPVITTRKRYWLVRLSPGGGGSPPLTDEGWSFIKSDLKPSGNGQAALSTNGNFTHLRFRVNGTDYPVVSFATLPAQGPLPARPDVIKIFDEDMYFDHQSKGKPLTFWVAASTSAFPVNDALDVEDAVSLHAMTAPASNATPLHIWPGWSSGNPWGTIHPMQVVKDILDGVYSSSSEALPYYSTQSFTGTNDVRRLPTVGTAYRVTQPARLREWMTEHLLTPHGIVAFADAQGRVAFKSVHLANPQLGYSTASLYTFSSTNLRAPHPDWRTTRREQVTQVELEYERVSLSVAPGGIDIGQGAAQYTPSGFVLGGDGISVKTDTVQVNYDRINRYGTFPMRYNFHGYGTIGDYNPYNIFPSWVTAMQYYQGEFVQRVFDRFGDGPIQGTLYALPNASTVQPGDFCKLTLGSYPNISSGGYRGGSRLVQILTKDITPEGYVYEYLDSAAAVSPLTSPTLSLSTSTADPKHSLRVTVSGGVPTGGTVGLYMAESATTTAPGSTSAAWHPVMTSGPFGQVAANGTYTLPQLKSNQRFFVKGQAAAPNSVRSQYSTPVTKVTGSITSPSGLSMSSVKAHTAWGTWTVGDARYPLNIHVDTTTTGTPTTGNFLYQLPPGSNRTFLQGLHSTTTYKLWVRHGDAFGGYSGFDSTTFTMTSTATTSNVRKAPPLGGLYLVFGSA